MMNTPTKKFIVAGGALVVLILVSCGLTGCKLPWSKGGNQGDSAVTNTAEIPGLPPDPGEAGKATLGGIDSDNDGVRDDIFIAVVERYPNDKNKQSALIQDAKVLQEAIIAGNTSDKQEVFRIAKAISRSLDCLRQRMEDPSAESSFIEDIAVNTKARGEAYSNFNSILSDNFFGDDETQNPCDSEEVR